MKKQILSVLLAVSVLSTNLFAVPVEQQMKGVERDLYDGVAQVESDTCVLEEEDESIDSDDADVGDVESYQEALNVAAASASAQETTSTNEENNQSKPQSGLVQDMQMHGQNNRIFDDTNADAWEAKRQELEKYIWGSYWITWKLLSEGDAEFAVALTSVGFKLPKLVALVFGLGGVVDKIEDAMKDAYHDTTEGSTDPISKEHRLNVLYVKIQRNAFNLLFITRDDYFKLIQEYPEVGYLFEDLYTFFKWRAHLREFYVGYKYNEYKYNEYMLYKIFKKALNRNSFEAWWELANIAKQEMKTALNNTQNMETAVNEKNICLSSKNARQEKENMKQYIFNANNALEAGREWNGIQRYAVLKHALPCNLYPKRGAGTVQMKAYIKDSMRHLTKEEMKQTFMDFRSAYIKGRKTEEPKWQQFYKENQLDSYKCVLPEGEVLEQNKIINPIPADFSFIDEVGNKLLEMAAEE